MKEIKVSELKGKIFKSVIFDNTDGCNSIEFTDVNNNFYSMEHLREWCEKVYLEDICGNLEDLVGSEVIMAEEASNKGEDNHSCWTFYKFATRKGYVTLRWIGESNGWYAMDVGIYTDYDSCYCLRDLNKYVSETIQL